MRAALDRLESELGVSEYLVGEEFTVADLTAASLFYPLVLPPEGPCSPGPRPGFRSGSEARSWTASDTSGWPVCSPGTRHSATKSRVSG